MFAHSLHQKKSLIGSPLIAIPLGLLFLRHSEILPKLLHLCQSNNQGTCKKSSDKPAQGESPPFFKHFVELNRSESPEKKEFKRTYMEHLP
jgi:hypothetical protein